MAKTSVRQLLAWVVTRIPYPTNLLRYLNNYHLHFICLKNTNNSKTETHSES